MVTQHDAEIEIAVRVVISTSGRAEEIDPLRLVVCNQAPGDLLDGLLLRHRSQHYGSETAINRIDQPGLGKDSGTNEWLQRGLHSQIDTSAKQGGKFATH
jgi:hypothetical protein